MERAYSHQGHGPRADQKGRIQIREVRLPARSHLRSAAGPYKSLLSVDRCDGSNIPKAVIVDGTVGRLTRAPDHVRYFSCCGRSRCAGMGIELAQRLLANPRESDSLLHFMSCRDGLIVRQLGTRAKLVRFRRGQFEKLKVSGNLLVCRRLPISGGELS